MVKCQYLYHIPTHGGLDVISRPKDDSNAYYQYGYKVQKIVTEEGSGESTDPAYKANNLKNDSQIELVSGINSSMYFKGICWLSSPSDIGPDYMMSVYPDGTVYYFSYTTSSVTFRPLVCLKSNVHLVEKTNGNTTTYELEVD